MDKNSNSSSKVGYKMAEKVIDSLSFKSIAYNLLWAAIQAKYDPFVTPKIIY